MDDFDLRNLRPKIIIGYIVIGVAALLLGVSTYYFGFTPKASAAHNKSELGSVPLGEELKIDFNRPIDRNSLEASIEPDVAGRWEYQDSIMGKHLFRSLAFIPDESFPENSSFKISLKNISNISGLGKPTTYELNFKTQTIPVIAGSNIADGQTGVSVSDHIEIYLDQPNDKVADFNFSLEPAREFDVELSADYKTYSIVLAAPLEQSTDYVLKANRIIKLGDEKLKEDFVWSVNFKTKEGPMVASYSPQGDQVAVDTSSISINFKTDMRKEEVLRQISVSPNVGGKWSFEGNKKIVMPLTEKLNYNTTYTIKIAPKIYDTEGNSTKSDTIITFKTIGYVTVASSYPAKGASGVAVDSSIWLNFNQEVDHDSAQNAFSISPNVNGSFSWQSNKMIFKPSANLSKDTGYAYKVRSGIKSVRGLDSTADFSYSFSTVTSATTLAVPMDYQDKALSCEAASLKMALAFKGANVSEDDIMNIVGFDPTPHSGNIWGDPYNAFVGDIHGRQNTTGYGVYWDPIARAAKAWRNAEAFSGGSLATLTGAISGGNPVVIWGVYGSGYYDPWVTPSGREIPAYKGEHARVVTGFTGTADNPKEFLINDPYAGKLKWSAATLLADWGKFFNSGVIVY